MARPEEAPERPRRRTRPWTREHECPSPANPEKEQRCWHDEGKIKNLSAAPLDNKQELGGFPPSRRAAGGGFPTWRHGGKHDSRLSWAWWASINLRALSVARGDTAPCDSACVSQDERGEELEGTAEARRGRGEAPGGGQRGASHGRRNIGKCPKGKLPYKGPKTSTRIPGLF